MDAPEYLKALGVPKEVIDCMTDFEITAEAGGLIYAKFTLVLIDSQWPKPKPYVPDTTSFTITPVERPKKKLKRRPPRG